MGDSSDPPQSSKREDTFETPVQPPSQASFGAMRPILPKEEQNEESVNLDAVPDARSSKRRCVSSACIPCRKRKSKCDGGTPACSTCTAVYHTECVYDINSDHRRKGALKRDIETLRERNGALGIIVASIRSSSDLEVADIVQQIRADENLEAIADSLRKNMLLPRRSDSHSFEGDLSDIIGKSFLSQSGETRHFGHTSSLGLVSHEEAQPIRNLIPPESWTRVTRDAALVGHLMSLYFCWQHPVFVLLSQECFLHDMSKGRTKYCSPLLVNALLAVACGLSNRPELRTDPDDSKTAGDSFDAEAKRLLFENEHSSLTTVQALAMMGLREVSCGRDSSGFHLMGSCMRMAIELGLHLGSVSSENSVLSPTEIEVRKITFWGCFTLDTVWSVCIGRIPQLPRVAITIEKPTMADQIELKPWKMHTEQDVPIDPETKQASHVNRVLHHFSLLSEIVNDMLFMFYAPRELFTSKKLLDLHTRLQRWYKDLPPSLIVTSHATPQLLLLHLYYHTVVLHLFRPFLKVDLANSKISPRSICNLCAEKVSAILDSYRSLYTLRRTSVLLPHIVISVCTIYLIKLPSPSAGPHLAQLLNDLKAMSINHPLTVRMLRIVLSLGKRWELDLPLEVQRAAGSLSPEAVFPALMGSHPLFQDPRYVHLDTLPGRRVQTQPAIDDIIPISNISQGPVFNRSDLFWSPFLDQGVPLPIGRDGGPMEITDMLDGRFHDWVQYQRDGFKMVSVADPSMGQRNMYDDWAQA